MPVAWPLPGRPCRARAQADLGATTAERTIVLLTVFQKTRQHDQKQIDRAVRAQKTCERDHRGPPAEAYERQV